MENLQAMRRARQKLPARQIPAPEPGDGGNPVVLILSAGLIAEITLPWIAVWLSDTFFLDVPPWALWALFGVPPVLTLLAMLVHWAARVCMRHLLGRSSTAWRMGGLTSCCR